MLGCGNGSAPAAPQRAAVSELAAGTTALAVYSVFSDGYGPPCLCDDGNEGRGVRTDELTAQGNHVMWAGCASESEQDAHPLSPGCSTFQANVTALTPEHWLHVKRTILQASPLTLAGDRDCHTLEAGCPDHYVTHGLLVTIDGKAAAMNWASGTEESLSAGLQTIIGQLSDLEFRF